MPRSRTITVLVDLEFAKSDRIWFLWSVLRCRASKFSLGFLCFSKPCFICLRLVVESSRAQSLFSFLSVLPYLSIQSCSSFFTFHALFLSSHASSMPFFLLSAQTTPILRDEVLWYMAQPFCNICLWVVAPYPLQVYVTWTLGRVYWKILFTGYLWAIRSGWSPVFSSVGVGFFSANSFVMMDSIFVLRFTVEDYRLI